MKKWFVFLVCISLSFPMNGCAKRQPASAEEASSVTASAIFSSSETSVSTDISSEETKLVFENNELKLTAAHAKRIFDPVDGKWEDFIFRMSNFGFCGDRIFLFEDGRAWATGEYWSPAYRYYSYNFHTDALEKLGVVDHPSVSAGSVVLMHGGMLAYTTQGVSNGEAADTYDEIQFLKLDAQQQKLTVLERERGITSPFVYFNKLSKDEFITFTIRDTSADRTVKTGRTISTIKRYNCNTDQGITIIEESYDYAPGSGSGVVLEQVCAMDGKIYAIARKYNGQDFSNYIYVYNSDGVLQNSLPIDEARSIFDTVGGTVLRLYVIGEYLLLQNWSMDCAIFKWESGQLKEIVPISERIRWVEGLDNIYESETLPYIFFVHKPTREGKIVDSYLFALNRQTGTITKIEVSFDAEYKGIEQCYVDEYGNIILVLKKDFLESFNTREYYIEANSIRNLLKL